MMDHEVVDKARKPGTLILEKQETAMRKGEIYVSKQTTN